MQGELATYMCIPFHCLHASFTAYPYLFANPNPNPYHPSYGTFKKLVQEQTGEAEEPMLIPFVDGQFDIELVLSHGAHTVSVTQVSEHTSLLVLLLVCTERSINKTDACNCRGCAPASVDSSFCSFVPFFPDADEGELVTLLLTNNTSRTTVIAHSH